MENSILDMANTVMASDFGIVSEPNTAEEYQRLGSLERFMLQIKWIQQQYSENYNGNGEDLVLKKLRKFDKPLEKTIYRVIKNNIEIASCLSRQSIIDDLNLTDKLVSYICRYSKQTLKNPKYKEAINYKIHRIKLKLVGDDYVVC